ncbi:hypothetical protein HanRHA438_Chr07g0302441 [Helianthus annuus]|uniref:Uncharacterized protein n=1 Tax=Helianthus annuus TaxID=4232 RepID=A0A9K3IJZ6_HELAN|nr:hypothetical protein HanXRQr2_Chr07g0291951 [Helianthus annuus]KAJ0549966.1 hypothetical protein HanHA300_Chr07g0240091 [Helianthus annuus]KAJ0556537.1 hypothetical protein HanIR_Chr07g0315011 [Helianthus annuus]KAJ0562926.1 hypothetical protein HanHA89_Chr07g0257321 [Helianthus annuus]KAJ0728292.1 hypothetical protein HanLR1_Chr07g0239971 [Helianthus annuus]
MNTYLFYVFVCVAKSSKSSSKFGVSDIQDIVSPRSIKKELAACQSIPEGKGMSTRAKAGNKRKKPPEPTGDLPLIEQQLHEFVSEKFVEIQILQCQHLADAEECILDLQTIAAAKDKRIAHLEKENKVLKKQVLLAGITANKERLEIIDDTKNSAAIVTLKIRLQMAKEAADPSFDRAEWDVASWKQRCTSSGTMRMLQRC